MSKKELSEDIVQGIPVHSISNLLLRQCWLSAHKLLELVGTIKGAMKVRRLISAMTSEIKSLDEQYQVILEEFAAKDEDGKMLPPDENGNVKLDDPSAFLAKSEELMNLEAEFSVHPIRLKHLGDINERGIGQILNPLIEAGLVIDIEDA